jgi:hypothetical protein
VVRRVDERDSGSDGVINSRLTYVAEYDKRGRVLRTVEDYEHFFNDGRLFSQNRVILTFEY